MSNTVESLSQEHQLVFQHLQALSKPAEGLEKGTGGIQEIKDFSSFLEKEILVHLNIEEQALFPVLGQLIGTESGPIAVMLSEHQDMLPKFRELIALSKNSSLSEDASRKRAAWLARYIIDNLYNHAQKEEQILFPFAQSALSPEQKDEIDKASENIRLAEKIKEGIHP